MPATIDLLSSSPTKPHAAYTLSSSPLPTLQEIAMGIPPVLRTGSQAVPIPQYAAASFTTASSLPKTSSKGNAGVGAIRAFRRDIYDVPESDGEDTRNPAKLKARKATKKPEGDAVKKARKVAMEDADGEEEQKKPRKPRAKKLADGEEITAPKEPRPRKPRAKKTEDASKPGGLAKDPKPRKPRAKKDVAVLADGVVPKEKPPRKTKQKKAADEGTQNTLPQAQITKASIPKAKSSSTSESKSKPTLDNDPFTDSTNFGLVEASKRRTKWTPPPSTVESAGTSSVTFDLIDTPGPLGTLSEAKNGFKNLLGNFGFAKPEGAAFKAVSMVEGTRKRKLIELAKTSVSANSPSPKKKVAKVAKKPRTITEQATSAYAEEAEPTPLRQYFGMQPAEAVTNSSFKVPAKPRQKSPTKPVYKGSVPILLSPASALEHVEKQDFVFGTSSQLAREEDSALLRDLHAALQASNEPDNDPFADSPAVKVLNAGKRRLWAAASRDSNGALLGVDMVDLVDSPAADKAVAKLPTSLRNSPAPPLKAVETESWLELDASELPPSPARVSKSASAAIGPIEAAIRAELLSSPPSKRQSSLIKDSTPKKSKPRKPGRPATTKAMNGPKMPNFESYTTAQLMKQIASYRFKPIKSRDAMIAMLEKCWEHKNKPTPALGVLDTNVAIGSPKRGRGRPRKDSPAVSPKARKPKKSDSIEYLDMDSDTPLSQIRTPKKTKKAIVIDEDISASDAEPMPSPRRRSASKSKRLPQPLRLLSSPYSISVDDQTALFKHITLTIKSAPPSTNPKEPSWHEKILLYDPIIIEDLTIWLNGGKLSEVGWDDEVDVKEVKKWCEGNSVCCLWRENLRGGNRARY